MLCVLREDRRRCLSRHHAASLPRAQEPGEGLAVPHGRLRVPAALPRDGDGAAGLHLHRDDAAVHRLAHHVRAHARHPQGRAQHVLLDPPDLHAQLGALEARRRRRAAPGRRQDEGRARQEARQVLPVGRLLPILPGRIFCETSIRSLVLLLPGTCCFLHMLGLNFNVSGSTAKRYKEFSLLIVSHEEKGALLFQVFLKI